MKKLIKIDWKSNAKTLTYSPRFYKWMLLFCAIFGFLAGIGFVMEGSIKNVIVWAAGTLLAFVLLAQQVHTVYEAQTPTPPDNPPK